MGIFKRLFKREPEKYVDKNGIYMNVECHRCKRRMRVRADRQYDLNRSEDGLQWNKTIVCDKCYSKIPTVVTFNNKYQITTQDINGGRYLSDEQVAQLEAKEAAEAEEAARKAAEEEANE